MILQVDTITEKSSFQDNYNYVNLSYINMPDNYVDLSDNFVVIYMALTGQEHVF